MVGSAIYAKALTAFPESKIMAIARKECDLRDASAILEVLKHYQPQIVIHCAAKVSGIAGNARNPSSTFKENQQIDHNLIWGALNAGLERVFLIGSSSMLPPSDDPICEASLLNGFPDPGNYGYGLSKAMTTKLGLLLSNLGRTQFRTLVAPNLYGEGDRKGEKSAHLLNAIITKTLDARQNNRREVTMWGDGTAKREFMYAGDFAEFIIDVGIPKFDRLPPILNVGVGHDFSIREYYEMVFAALGEEFTIVPDTSKPTGAAKKLLDQRLFRSLFDWKPRTDITDGIRKLLDDYRSTGVSFDR